MMEMIIHIGSMKNIINCFGLFYFLKCLIYLYLYIDYKTCAEMPQIKQYKKQKYLNFKI